MIHVIEVGIYNISVVCIVGTDEKELNSFYYYNTKRMTNEERDSIISDMRGTEYFGTTFEAKCGDIVMWLKNTDNIGFVAHELYHVVNRILMGRGVNHDIDDEPFAYLLGWLIKEFYNKFEFENR